MAVVGKEILSGFYEEVKGYLPTIRRCLEELAADPSQTQPLQEVHRLVHSIKGAASMVGLAVLSHMAFLIEEALEDVEAGKLKINSRTASSLNKAIDQVEAYVEGSRKGVLEQRPVVINAVKAVRRFRNLAASEDQAAVANILKGAAESGGSVSEPAMLESGPAFEFGLDEDEEAAPDLMEAFRTESEEHMQVISGSLRKLEKDRSRQELVQEVRRSVHTLKGASGMVGLQSTSRLAHRMEDLLDQIHEGGAEISDRELSLLFGTADTLEDLSGGQVDREKLIPRLRELYSQYAELVEKDASDLSNLAAGVTASGGAPADSGRLSEVSTDLLGAFRVEAEEHLNAIGASLRSLEAKREDKNLTMEVRRKVHTLKGAASMIGLASASRLAHRMEDLLDQVHDGSCPFSDTVRDLMFSSADALEDLCGGTAPENIEAIYSSYAELIGEEEAPAASAAAGLAPLGEEAVIDLAGAPSGPRQDKQEDGADGARIVRRPGQIVRVPLERIDELVRLVSELVVNRSTFEQYFAKYMHEVDELGLSLERLRRVSAKLETEYAVGELVRQETLAPAGPAAVSRTGPGPGEGDFDTLELDRYGSLHLVSRDLTETCSDIGSVGNELGAIVGDFDSYLNRLGRLSSEVQDKLMRLRMVPLAAAASRLHRTVRVTAAKEGKQAELAVEGEAVELDKTVFEEMIAPLEHLLRNAVAHGVEPPELRRAMQKPPEGRLRVRAYYEGTQVVVQVGDDGAGLNYEDLRAKAVSLGLLDEAEATEVPERELASFMFQPGFSTAAKVTEVSGRGVGLDIVKSAVTRLKGTISVKSEPGRGVTFTVRLPMTLAITRVLLVKAHGETLAVPLGAVTQIIRVEPSGIESVGRKPVIRIEGEVVPVVELGKALNLPQAAETSGQRFPVLVLRLGERKIAIAVERLIEAREVVVKTLGTLLRRVHGVTGATLMGDGSVVLIVNPSDLISGLAGEAQTPPASARANRAAWLPSIRNRAPSADNSNDNRRASWRGLTRGSSSSAPRPAARWPSGSCWAGFPLPTPPR